ncbi:SDR family oxidoreductase [Pajaroellobacter abortibovis]|uniref:Thioester reductase (TE) domain-containing protein n=1 Tax=Pajaroellobacter abortibovis TaxID=1882918 RepID=A0A1L6MWS4_9BACT|nr:hypothetical protein BCY86_04310 [Pajaroellobacter abortibovis]
MGLVARPIPCKIYLLMRSKKNESKENRFWNKIVPSEEFSPLRKKYPGSLYDLFLKEKVEVVEGDVTQPLCRVETSLIDSWKGLKCDCEHFRISRF